MEGREQKYQSIYKYSTINTTYQNRWPFIFRHEFIQLVHLRENGYDDVKYNKTKSSYLPIANQKSCKNCCICLEDADFCYFCESVVVLYTIKKVLAYFFLLQYS